jgi:hypothetical protein
MCKRSASLELLGPGLLYVVFETDTHQITGSGVETCETCIQYPFAIRGENKFVVSVF